MKKKMTAKELAAYQLKGGTVKRDTKPKPITPTTEPTIIDVVSQVAKQVVDSNRELAAAIANAQRQVSITPPVTRIKVEVLSRDSNGHMKDIDMVVERVVN